MCLYIITYTSIYIPYVYNIICYNAINFTDWNLISDEVLRENDLFFGKKLIK